MFTTDLQKTVFLNTYSRWHQDANRRETWEETTSRVMAFFANQLSKRRLEDQFTDGELWQLEKAMTNLDVLPSMRIVQMAGPALERCNVGAYNCAYLPLKDWRSFSELLYILMQGTGCGFSVEGQYVNQLPIIKKQSYHCFEPSVIEDSTEGWCNAFMQGLEVWANGGDIEFDYSQIRPYGTPLKTKGGKASGPEPLQQLLDFARKLLLNHQGRRLSSLNVHDLACYCGSIVQVGGVRRAAEISLSDPKDEKMSRAKNGQFWLSAPERAMANNSAVYTKKPSMSDFIEEWTTIMNSGTGERGIFNRNAPIPSRRKREQWSDSAGYDGGMEDIQFGVNPCGEIILRPFQFCNLSIAVARPEDDIDTLSEKVKLATQFGIIQSLLTDFKYIRKDWKVNCEQERLLGVDITGQADCSLFWGETREYAYATLQAVAVAEAERLSTLLGIPMPAAVTCVKPSGNSSQLLNVASSPVAKLLRSSGVPHHPEVGQLPTAPSVWVFDFPVASPKGARIRRHMNALAQLDQWLSCKLYYTEHNPSCTVYVKEDEWLEVGAWVYKNWHSIGGLSFLPFDGGVYDLAPYESITEDTYNKLVAAWPLIDFDQLSFYEHSDATELNREFACTGDKGCEL